jgi:uncharacterized iron-regulated membrane protein
MRQTFVVLHRWFGLFTAVFLFIAGFTGAIISWDHELDEWLNPKFHRGLGAAQRPTQPHDALALADQIERSDGRVQVSYLPLTAEPGRALSVFVQPRIDPAKKEPFEVPYNQLALDPVSGELQAKRMWGDVSLRRENILSFLYRLHYSMHIPEGFGIEFGMLFMGIVAIVWAIDCFIALWLSFPNRKVWRKSFAFRLREGGVKLNFDLHRSGGVWVWAILLMLAVTAVSMNLGDQVMRPLVSVFSTLSESPFDSRTPRPPAEQAPPAMTRARVLELAVVEATKHGLSAPAGGLFYSADFNVYGVGFFHPDNDHGDGGLGNPWLYFDGTNGKSVGTAIPGTGSAGDIFMQAQFPLHSGRIVGLPGRIFVSFMGAVVAMLSVTGIVIWARKRRARAFSEARSREGQRALASSELGASG